MRSWFGTSKYDFAVIYMERERYEPGAIVGALAVLEIKQSLPKCGTAVLGFK